MIPSNCTSCPSCPILLVLATKKSQCATCIHLLAAMIQQNDCSCHAWSDFPISLTFMASSSPDCRHGRWIRQVTCMAVFVEASHFGCQEIRHNLTATTPAIKFRIYQCLLPICPTTSMDSLFSSNFARLSLCIFCCILLHLKSDTI